MESPGVRPWARHLALDTDSFGISDARRVKAFRVAKGIKVKTDAIDCRLLCDFGRDQLNEGQLRFGRLENLTLAALVARRRQLNGLLHDERCRRETAAIDWVQASIARTIATLERELATIAAEIRPPYRCRCGTHVEARNDVPAHRCGANHRALIVGCAAATRLCHRQGDHRAGRRCATRAPERHTAKKARPRSSAPVFDGLWGQVLRHVQRSPFP